MLREGDAVVEYRSTKELLIFPTLHAFRTLVIWPHDLCSSCQFCSSVMCVHTDNTGVTIAAYRQIYTVSLGYMAAL